MKKSFLLLTIFTAQVLFFRPAVAKEIYTIGDVIDIYSYFDHTLLSDIAIDIYNKYRDGGYNLAKKEFLPKENRETRIKCLKALDELKKIFTGKNAGCGKVTIYRTLLLNIGNEFPQKSDFVLLFSKDPKLLESHIERVIEHGGLEPLLVSYDIIRYVSFIDKLRSSQKEVFNDVMPDFVFKRDRQNIKNTLGMDYIPSASEIQGIIMNSCYMTIPYICINEKKTFLYLDEANEVLNKN